MSRQSSGSPTPDDAAWPDDYDPRYQPPGQPPPWPGYGPGGPPPRRSGRGLIIAAAAVVAAVVGAGAALAVKEWPSSSPPSTSSSSLPNAGIGAGAGAGAGGHPQGQYLHIVMEGKVTAVSSSSITIQGTQHTVTASITSATKITGQASSISGIKVGENVSAEITKSGGQTVVDALQYPPNPPSVG